MSTPSGCLRGPHADAATTLIETALTMTREQAVRLSRAYEADENPHYLAHCAIIQDALEVTDRTLSLGWFEAVFRYADWVLDTKALHAIADVVSAMLVGGFVPLEVVDALSLPWATAIGRIPEAALQG